MMNKKLFIALLCTLCGAFLIFAGARRMSKDERQESETEEMSDEKLNSRFRAVSVEGDLSAADVENFEARLRKTGLEVFTWDKSGIHYKVNKLVSGKKEQKIDITTDDKTLCFKEAHDRALERLLEKRWGNRPKAVITLYIPEGFTFKSFYLKAGVGNVKIEDFAVTENMHADMGVGNLEAEGITANNVDIDSGVGKCNFTECTLNNVKIGSGVGECRFTACTSSDVDFDTGVGKIFYEGALKGEVNIDSGVGNVECSLKGRADEWNFDISGGVSSIRINGKKPAFLKAHSSTARYRSEAEKVAGTMRISSGVGKIKLDFED